MILFEAIYEYDGIKEKGKKCMEIILSGIRIANVHWPKIGDYYELGFIRF